MSIVGGLIGMLFMLMVLVAGVFFVIFVARRLGLLKPSLIEGEAGEAGAGDGLNSYLSDLKSISKLLVFRFVMIALLVGVMTIPQDMVSDIVRERSGLYHQAIANIANSWGHRQSLKGPALLVPYTEKFTSVVIKTDKDGNERKVNKTYYEQRTAIVLPDDLNIEVELHGQTREVSLYEALVYTADLNITGSLQRPDLYKLSNHIDKIHWNRAWFSLGVSDTQAINKVSRLHWDNKGDKLQLDFEPGTAVVKTIPSGFHAALQLGPDVVHTSATDDTGENGLAGDRTSARKKSLYHFSLQININGSEGLYFTPFGKTTNVRVKSDWPHPSFKGNVLPDSHDISAEGFQASWSIPHLARNYPQLWTLETQKFNLNEFQAGVNLFETVSLYSQVTRAIKYGVLFLFLTYITFLIFELGIGRRLHLVQYGMIGFALSMFYLVLLSMAEHAGFIKAYISAATIIIVMISLYAYAAIRKIAPSGLIALLLTGLYSILYSLLKLEDYALLAGTALLLVILGTMMYLTRNVGNKETNPKEKHGKALSG